MTNIAFLYYYLNKSIFDLTNLNSQSLYIDRQKVTLLSKRKLYIYARELERLFCDSWFIIVVFLITSNSTFLLISRVYKITLYCDNSLYCKNTIEQIKKVSNYFFKIKVQIEEFNNLFNTKKVNKKTIN